MSFLKTGAAAHAELEKAESESLNQYEPYRFWLKENAEARITFVDGHLIGELLNANSYYEHMQKRVGRSGYDTYPCTQETEACPICESGGVPSLVFALTILDHREWKDKAGKVHQHERKLYICKRDTFKKLQLKAAKRGGLSGCTFDVARVGEKSASVGTEYEFVGKTPIAEVALQCGLAPEDVVPFDYAATLKYLSAAELRKIGFGVAGIGAADTAALKTESKPSNGKGSLFNQGPKSFDASKEL